MSSDPAVTTDAFLGGALMLRQPERGYRAGIDPVLLAATCPEDGRETAILDCGAGIGTVGLCIARRLPKSRVTLVEREPVLAGLARANIAANALTERVELVVADLAAPLSKTPGLAARAGTFDHVLANPPFHVDAAGTRSADPVKDGANAMPEDGLDAWARFMAAMCRGGGTATMIHRSDALPAILSALANRFGGLTILPVHPRADEPANRIIVRGIKGSRAPLTMLPPLVLHSTEGHGYEPDVEAVLRRAAALPFATRSLRLL